MPRAWRKAQRRCVSETVANEAYRLRSLAFEWQKLAGAACDEFRDYKCRLYCGHCDESAEAHAYKEAARQLLALLAEPELLLVSVGED